MSRKSQSNPVSLFAFQDIITAVIGIILLLVLLLTLCLVQLPDEHGDPKVSTKSSEEIDVELNSVQQQIQDLKSQQNSDLDVDLMSEQDLKDEIEKYRGQYAILSADNTKLKGKKKENEQKGKELDDELKSKGRMIEIINVLETKIKKDAKELKQIKDKNMKIYNFNSSTELPWLVDLYKDKFMIARAKSKKKPTVFTNADIQTRTGELIAWLESENISDKYFLLIARDKTAVPYRSIRNHIEDNGGSIGTEIESVDVQVLNENGPVTK